MRDPGHDEPEDDVSPDELRGGSDRSARLGGPVLAAALVAVAVVVAWRAGPELLSAPTPPTRSSSATARPSAERTPATEPELLLTTEGQPCVRRDGRDGLRVTLGVVNLSDADVVIERFVPQFPLGGLVVRQVLLGIAGCGIPASGGSAVAAGDTLAVRLQLGVVDGCTSATPVTAEVSAHRSGAACCQKINLPVLDDLAGVVDSSCKRT